MESRECSDLLETLTSILQQKELGWVLDEFNEQLRLGRTEDLELRIPKTTESPAFDSEELDLFEQPIAKVRRKGRLTTFQQTRPYTPCEQLELLIEAIEQAVVNTAKIANDALLQFHKEADISRIEFYSEEEGKETLVLSQQDILVMVKNAERLHELLMQLRTRI